MKKIYVALFALLGLGLLSQAVQAQGACTPITTQTAVGLYPQVLDTGTVNSPYSMQIDFVMFKDTLFQGTTLYVCSFELTNILKLPPGVTVQAGGPTYQAGSNPPKWNVSHAAGAVNKGCVLISGTPTDTVADDFILVTVNITPSLFNPNGGNCQPLTTAAIPYTDTLMWRVNPETIGSINTPTAEQIGLKVVPNPANGISAISMNLDKKQDIDVAIFDMMGREVASVYSGVATEGTQKYTVDTQSLPNGVYTLKVNLDGKSTVLNKFIVKN